MKPIIGITLGDVGGIGPEIVIKSVKKDLIREKCAPIVIGSGDIIKKEISRLNYDLAVKMVKKIEESDFTKGIVNVFEVNKVNLLNIKKGKINKEAGQAAMQYVEAGVRLAVRKKIAALVTAPLNKEGIHQAGYKFQGHTDYLAYLTKSKNYSMMFVHKDIRVLLVTIHVGLKEVSSLIAEEKVLLKIKAARQACLLLGVKNPRIGIAGLNPHAGEQGSFGREEIEKIIPAIKKAKAKGVRVTGPVPPDTLFYRGLKKKEFDIMVCMYHDQGLIPFKMIAFDKGVNMTVGLPIIRTSPDHGTAYDIAKQKVANPDSMCSAILTAVKLAKNVITCKRKSY